MRILNFGSLNIDHVYNVEHFVRPGETVASRGYHEFAGGKGCNQSIALARAGAEVCHAGKLGADGLFIKRKLERAGVDTTFVEIVDGPSGHAVIQVDRHGENAIILHGGANWQIDAGDAERVLAAFGIGDCLLLQNEISSLPQIMHAAAERGLTIVFNPAPSSPQVLSYPLELVDTFIVNQVEGGDLTGEHDPEAIARRLGVLYPGAAVVLTLGADGVLYADDQTRLRVPGRSVQAVDSTAAGDTFIGYFMAARLAGTPVAEALDLACHAAAVCVTRPGAVDSIPRRDEL